MGYQPVTLHNILSDVPLFKNHECSTLHQRPQKFFLGQFRPSFVTVHKCDGVDLGSISLKMAAGSILNGAVKYYPDRYFVGGKRTNKLHSGKRQENLVYRSSRCYSYSRNLKECGHQKVVPKHVDNTASDILGPLWSHRLQL